MGNKKDNRCIRYVAVKGGNVSIGYIQDFMKMMKDEYDHRFDSTDCLFDRYPDIRVFVKDESLFTEKPTVYYCRDNELMMTFNGTVFFAKLGITGVRSLSKKETAFLLNNLKRNDDNTYSIDA